MKPIISRQVSVAWLFVGLAMGAALMLLGKVALLDAPPRNAVLITPYSEQTATTQPSPAALGPGATEPPKPQEARLEATRTSGPVPDASLTPPPLVVYVSGAVIAPGVFSLPPGARVLDAVQAAGGLAENADGNGINLAEHVADEQHIVVPRKGETVTPPVPTRTQTGASRSPTEQGSKPAATPKPASSSTQTPGAPGGKVNINTATQAELESLPGIGASLAGRILEYRSAHGPFASIEEITKVPGIKEGIFARVKDYITVGN